MAGLFEAFDSELSKQQLSLLLETVQYFEEAPKLLSLPTMAGEHIALPILGATLSQMIEQLPEGDDFAKHRFHFAWEGADEKEGVLVITSPHGTSYRQQTITSEFSPV